MAQKTYDLLTEMIHLEMNVSHVYQLFSELFRDDRQFWWQLAMEEVNHAAILTSGRDIFLGKGLFPVDLLALASSDIHDMNVMLNGRLSAYRENPPRRDDAFVFAYQVETSAGEFHYQRIMTCASEEKQAVNLFKKLNHDDIDHAVRIEKYAKEHGITM